MADSQIWECSNSKCDETYVSPMPVSAFYKPCRCGTRRDWKHKAGPPPSQPGVVRSTPKEKESK